VFDFLLYFANKDTCKHNQKKKSVEGLSISHKSSDNRLFCNYLTGLERVGFFPTEHPDFFHPPYPICSAGQQLYYRDLDLQLHPPWGTPVP